MIRTNWYKPYFAQCTQDLHRLKHKRAMVRSMKWNWSTIRNEYKNNANQDSTNNKKAFFCFFFFSHSNGDTIFVFSPVEFLILFFSLNFHQKWNRIYFGVARRWMSPIKYRIFYLGNTPSSQTARESIYFVIDSRASQTKERRNNIANAKLLLFGKYKICFCENCCVCRFSRITRKRLPLRALPSNAQRNNEMKIEKLECEWMGRLLEKLFYTVPFGHFF